MSMWYTSKHENGIVSAEERNGKSHTRGTDTSGDDPALSMNRPSDQGQIVIVFEVAPPIEITPLLFQVYQLTRREGEVTQLSLRGQSTQEIVQNLHISLNTVQDHLKAIFENVNVSSRRELVGRIFASI